MSAQEHKDSVEGQLGEHKEGDVETSDRDNDEFEDANDTASIESAPVEVVERTRSLTNRRSSSAKSTKSTVHEIPTSPPPVPSRPGTMENAQTGAHTHEKENIDGNEEESIEETKQPSSPLLTSHRISNSSLDNIDLDEDLNGSPIPLPPKAKAEESKPSLPPKVSKISLQGLSGALPSVPWSPPPPPPPPPAPVSHNPLPAPPPTRKLTSPFSWLSRNTSQAKEPVVSPPLPSANNAQRRNTASSIATVASNPEMMLSKLEEGHESDATGGNRRPLRSSLRDRFKMARLREEGITDMPEEERSQGGLAGFMGKGSVSLGLGLASPAHAEDRDPSLSAYSPLSPHPPSPNPALAPGTAAGVSAGPSAMTDAPVDWDLWQAVVDEGPAAVARTSPDELNRAIATGIPNVIRGVVWQILAQSKNEELESVYRELVNRGTDKDKDRMSGSSGAQSTYSNGRDKDDAAIVSSSSSIHSDHSTPATTITNGMRSPSPPKDPEVLAKAQAVALALKKKKAKEDSASLLKLEKAIKRDLGARTSFSKFAASAGMQESLFGVCKAYALFDEGVGYAQGMTFLVSPLLFNLPEEEAFGLLVRLMNQYHLRDLFIHDMPGLHKQLYQFERLLEDFEPALYCHLRRRGVTPHLYATQWFLTLFAYRFPLQLVLRIYDLILSEGLEAILKFGIVLMQKNSETLRGMTDMVALTNFLKDRLFDVYIDQAPSANSIMESGFFGSSAASIDKEVYRADQLIEDACAVKITPEVLKTYSMEWEEKTRLEKDREAELELLRSTNLSLTHKVRRLEERVEEHDSEHAALATELVKTKVENEELKDEHESLKGQVRELRIVIEKQPEEVEARLKSEMDRLIRQNQEVHEDNTRLEEEMGEMEKNLVETKMQYAEVNAAHETLTRKFRDMKKALDQD